MSKYPFALCVAASLLVCGSASAESIPVAMTPEFEAPEHCAWAKAGDAAAPRFLLGCTDADGGGLTEVQTPDGFDKTTVRRARDGDAEALASLGLFYAVGPAMLRDYPRAAELFQQAADKGEPVGAFYLASMHETDAEGDKAEAVRLYRIAAERGVSEAMFALGRHYVEGTEVAKDVPEAIRWFKLAAAKGHMLAIYNLYSIYRLGHGVPKDPVEAAYWGCRADDRELIVNRAVEMVSGFNPDLPIWAEDPAKIRKQASEGLHPAQPVAEPANCAGGGAAQVTK